jgi:hypothetical protein
VPDARKGLPYAVVAIAPLLLIGLIVLSFPFEELLADDLRWAYVFPVLSALIFVYLGVVFLVLNAKIPLTPYRHSHRKTAKRGTVLVLLIAIIAGIAWYEWLPSNKFEVSEAASIDIRIDMGDERDRPISDVLRPAPYFVNGKLVGYRVYPGEDREVFSVLGLQLGDLVTEIDGQLLDDPARAFELFKILASGRPVQIKVERSRQPEEIETQDK